MPDDVTTVTVETLEDALLLLKEEADKRQRDEGVVTPQSKGSFCVEFKLFGYDAHLCLLPFHVGVEF